MHLHEPPPTAQTGQRYAWWRDLNRYHWFVLIVAALGWLFDCLDQQLFNIARRPAMMALLNANPSNPDDLAMVTEYSGYATSIFLIGWATGGIAFGILGDILGRARTMVMTILLYSLFTGLSAFSVGFWDFALYRFLTGLGVGGEFAVGVALVAEVMPDRARPFALGMLQALSAVGNITAALIAIALSYMAEFKMIEAGQGWRIMFVIGTVPALLALVIRRRLKEPERWQAVAAEASISDRLAAYRRDLFSDPRWARHAVIGLLLASAGVIGLWSIGFFAIDLQQSVFRAQFTAQGLPPDRINVLVGRWAGLTSLMLNIGAFFGIYLFCEVADRIGRRPTFAISFLLAMVSTAVVFLWFDSMSDVFWMIPIMGFCQLTIFGGYAVYLPELFPTRLRSTGTSFCYNVGRFAAAVGPAILGLLTRHVFADYPQPLRPAGVVMCSIFLLGIIVLPFAPETRGKPLPE